MKQGRAKKKPVTIDFFLWKDAKFEDLGSWVIGLDGLVKLSMCFVHHPNGDVSINTLESNDITGSLAVSEGDYIIRGVKGEYYPCKPDIFHLTYDLVK